MISASLLVGIRQFPKIFPARACYACGSSQRVSTWRFALATLRFADVAFFDRRICIGFKIQIERAPFANGGPVGPPQRPHFATSKGKIFVRVPPLPVWEEGEKKRITRLSRYFAEN